MMNRRKVLTGAAGGAAAAVVGNVSFGPTGAASKAAVVGEDWAPRLIGGEVGGMAIPDPKKIGFDAVYRFLGGELPAELVEAYTFHTEPGKWVDEARSVSPAGGRMIKRRAYIEHGKRVQWKHIRDACDPLKRTRWEALEELREKFGIVF